MLANYAKTISKSLINLGTTPTASGDSNCPNAGSRHDFKETAESRYRFKVSLNVSALPVRLLVQTGLRRKARTCRLKNGSSHRLECAACVIVDLLMSLRSFRFAQLHISVWTVIRATLHFDKVLLDDTCVYEYVLKI
ncbi:hypothetical protein EVAR_48018_1 [Eumeta japonica]|uniref:Uncharacterized protein n=1 Tax=Eumeta variegata TaxID=151549 RepID=A0A4C1XQQ7_EUMVA|nr:hypothetical protein EVAR_48018_1 [Eumeta japonica]